MGMCFKGYNVFKFHFLLHFPLWGAHWNIHEFWYVDGSDQKAIRRNVIGVYTQDDSVRDWKTKMAIAYLQVVFSFKGL
jgi:hypothetical protein